MNCFQELVFRREINKYFFFEKEPKPFDGLGLEIKVGPFIVDRRLKAIITVSKDFETYTQKIVGSVNEAIDYIKENLRGGQNEIYN